MHVDNGYESNPNAQFFHLKFTILIGKNVHPLQYQSNAIWMSNCCIVRYKMTRVVATLANEVIILFCLALVHALEKGKNCSCNGDNSCQEGRSEILIVLHFKTHYQNYQFEWLIMVRRKFLYVLNDKWQLHYSMDYRNQGSSLNFKRKVFDSLLPTNLEKNWKFAVHVCIEL